MDDEGIEVPYWRNGRKNKGVPPDRLTYSTICEMNNFVLAQLTMAKGLAKHGVMAENSINDEFHQLFYTKKAIAPIKRKHIPAKYLVKSLCSSMFLKEKVDGNNVFEKLKSRLVADGSQQDKQLYSILHPPNAKIDSIFICLAMAATRRIFWGKVDIGRAYIDAFLDDGGVIIMIISKQLTKNLLKRNPSLQEFVHEDTIP